MGEKDVKKKKIKLKKYGFKRILIISLFIYLIGCLFLHLFNMPIQNIYIVGNEFLSDHEIIMSAGIKDYPSIFRTSSNSLRKKVLKNKLVKEVKIKKNLNGRLTIEVIENKPLFYNLNNEKVVLEDGSQIDNNNYLKLPTLINFVPTDIYKSLLNKIKKVDYDVLGLISEIEYAPTGTNKSDSDRFLLRMNDDNTVYITIINIKNLNLYPELFSSLEDGERGTFYLDSSNSENFVFRVY